MKFRKDYIGQYISALAAGLTVLGVGCTSGWTTVTLKRLHGPNSELPISSSQGSWIASCHELGHILSPIPSGYIVNKIGPKRCLISANFLLALGWIIIYFTRSVIILYFNRFLFGLAMGITFTITPLYLAEISSPDVRGCLSTGFETMLYLGHVIEFSIGPYVSYGNLALISLSIPVLFFLLIIWMTESPYFLLKIGKYDEARKILLHLWGITNHEDTEIYLNKMQEDINLKKVGSIKDLFLSKHNRKSLLIDSVLAITQRLSGMSAVVAYAAFIFSSTPGGLSSNTYTIAFGIISFLFTLVSAVLMDRSGRRTLTIVSYFGSFILQLITAVYFYYAINYNITSYTWLSFTTISLYAGFYSVGMGPIVTTIQGELFPPNIKGLAGSVISIIHAATSSVVTKLFQIIRDQFGVYVCFFIFSVNCLFGSVFCYFLLPETKGKPLYEIHQSL